jgi:cytochrome c oxidase cbb3-type subunit 2
MSSRFPVFFILVFATVALPWGILIFKAEEQLVSLRPSTSKLEYYYVDKDGNEYDSADAANGLTKVSRNETGSPQFPIWRGGNALRGKHIYESYGCIQCHTQQVRQKDFGVDIARKWGARQSVARDYLFDSPVLLGRMRIGPDLANVGNRLDAQALHKHIYRPVAVSAMPGYPSLYSVIETRGDGSHTALHFETGEYGAPRAGWEVVPKQDANDLVDYLLSLKQDYELPEARVVKAGESGGGSVATEEDEFAGNKVLSKGKKLYNTPGACVTCHQADGQGNEIAKFPPLAGSDWVSGSEDVIVRVVLNGLQGPIKVNGKDYGTVLMAPTIWVGWPDEDIAAVISYVRNAWGNKSPEVSAETVKRIRAEIGTRTTPWTAQELEAFKK